MRPEPGLRLTIIAREVETPYSGMLPGHVAGVYERSEMHIDVARLARFAGANFIAGEVVGVEPDAKPRAAARKTADALRHPVDQHRRRSRRRT